MKKLASIILSVLIIACAVPFAGLDVSVKAENKKPAYIMGDLNGDDEVNITDAILVARSSSGLFGIPEDRKSFVDVNGDRDINISDAILIARYSSQLIDKFPVEGLSGPTILPPIEF